MPTKLSYNLTTDPFPLQANKSSTLIVVASNPTPRAADKPVLVGVSLTLTIGPTAADLATIAPATVEVPEGWEMDGDPKPGEGTMEYVFTPKGGPVVVEEQGLAFIFDAVQVNARPGTSTIKIKEGLKVNDRTVTNLGTLTVTKFPQGWGEVDFAVQPANITAGETTKLSWRGPEDAIYSIEYATPQQGKVIVPAGNIGTYPAEGQPPLMLDLTTVFTLHVRMTIGSREYHAQQQRTVTVVKRPLPPIPAYIGYFRPRGCEGNECVVYDYKLVLEWDIHNAKPSQCQLSEKDLTDPGSPSKVIQVSWEDNFVVLIPTKEKMRYTLMLDDKGNMVTATVTATLIPPVPVGTIVPFGGSRKDRLPLGWLYCNGSEYRRADYPQLYDVIGDTYGTAKTTGNGVLPDLRGYFVRGFDDGTGVDPSRRIGTIQDDAFKSHTHAQIVTANPNKGPTGVRADYSYDSSKLGEYDQGVDTKATGGSETRPKNLAFYYAIYAGQTKPPTKTPTKKKRNASAKRQRKEPRAARRAKPGGRR